MPRAAEALRTRLASSSARSWYPGGVFGGLYALIGVWFVWDAPGPLWSKALTTALLLVVPGLFVVLPPVLWGTRRVVAYPVLFGYTALICLLFPFIGAFAVWLFVYISCVAAACFIRFIDAAVWIGAVAVAQFVIISAAGLLADDWFIFTLTVSISTMLRGISQLSRANLQLKYAQGEIARLAVAEERARFSRDLHDVLGHSLTVVTVKSELAGRLVERDPARAQAELADIERLSRSALVDLRASIAGYREMNLDTELAAARAALAAAEVAARIPVSGDAVEPRLRELFAWTVRESVTNVIRHARASSCVIELLADSVRVCDDGTGAPAFVDAGSRTGTDAASGMHSGSGLAGLGERARAAGATLKVEPNEPRGTVVTVKADIR